MAADRQGCQSLPSNRSRYTEVSLAPQGLREVRELFYARRRSEIVLHRSGASILLANHPAGQRPGNLPDRTCNQCSQMVGPLALMFLLVRQPRPMAPMAWAGQTTGPLARKET